MNMAKRDMQGLYLFLSDIRKCQCKEDEHRIINQELANIRSKFDGRTTLNGYKKKKYLSKIVFIFLLGYESDIGVLEAINILSSNKYSEKFIGYMFLSVIVDEHSHLMLLVHNAVKNDLRSDNPVHQNLALQYAANMANASMVNVISSDVLKILLHNDTPDNIRQSAILCLLRILRVEPEAVPNDDYIQRVVCYISHPNLGMVTAVTSLLENLAEKGKLHGFPCVSNIVSKLHRIVKSNASDIQEYAFYFIPAPWVTIKLLKLLRNFFIPLDTAVRSRLIDCVELILNKCQEPLRSKKWEYRNTRNAIMFETIMLIHYMKVEISLVLRTCSILELELKRKDINLRYLALDAMCLLAEYDIAKDRIKKNLDPVKESLYFGKDGSIKQKASNLLFLLCDKSNVDDIIQELMHYIAKCEVCSREETALKVAYLAERFYEDPTWYVEIILLLLRENGEYVKEEIWYRFIQIIVRTESLHSYATKRVFDLVTYDTCNETIVKVSGYILGEFGNLIAGDPQSDSKAQFRHLLRHFNSSSLKTKALLLTTFTKFANLFPEIKENVRKILSDYTHHPNEEIQQRALEYSKLIDYRSVDFIFSEIPVKEDIKSLVKTALQDIAPDLSKIQLSLSKNICCETVPTRTVSEKPLISITAPDEELIRRSATENTTAMQQEATRKKSYCEILASEFSESKVIMGYNQNFNLVYNQSDKLTNLVWQTSGILFENDLLLVYTKTAFNKCKGTVLMMYRNKTIHPFRNFLPSFLFQDSVKIKLQMKPCMHVIFAGDEAKQEIEVECLQNFSERPALSVGFDCHGTYSQLPLELPITLNKFIEPRIIAHEDFKQRWFYLSQYNQGLKKIFHAKLPMEGNILIKKLQGMGMSPLLSISQSSSDVYGAGIFHCRDDQIEFLFHLQSKIGIKQYCLNVRSLNGSFMAEIIRLVEYVL